MNQLENRYTDPTWDYNSIWETLGEMQNSLAKMMELLSSEEADAGNEKVDFKLLEMVAKIKGDCIGIEKALKCEDKIEIYPNFLTEQYSESIDKSLKESVFIQKLMQKSLSHLAANVATLNQTIEQKKV